MLRRARENAGFDVVTMARRLHIRPDILKAIETADFAKMPARGYTRNMVRAYARQVGLDEREISDRFLDEIQLYETGVPRESGSSRPRRSSRYDSDSFALGSPSRRMDDEDRYSSRSQRIRRGSDSLSFNERDYPENDRQEKDRSIRFYSSPRSRSREREPRSQEFPVSKRIRPQAQSFRFDADDSIGKSIRLPKSSHSYTNIYSDNKKGSGIAKLAQVNMPLLIIIAIVAIALIIMVVVLFNGGKQAVDEVPNIPISGLTDTSDPEDDLSSIPQQPVAPVSAQFTYAVESGAQSWIEIYENGSTDATFAGVVTGPETKSYDVTGTLTFYTANPTPVTCMVDGKAVTLSPSSSKSGYYSYLVDFPAMLAAWKAENDPDAVQTTNLNTVSNTSSNTTNSNSSSTSNTSTRSSSTSNSRN